jgi:hypothetical protein
MATTILPATVSGCITSPSKNPAAVYLASLQPTGRRAMAGRLR